MVISNILFHIIKVLDSFTYTKYHTFFFIRTRTRQRAAVTLNLRVISTTCTFDLIFKIELPLRIRRSFIIVVFFNVLVTLPTYNFTIFLDYIEYLREFCKYRPQTLIPVRRYRPFIVHFHQSRYQASFERTKCRR